MRRRHIQTIGMLLLAALLQGQTLPAPPDPLPIPDTAAQNASRAVIRKLYENQYARVAPADRRALAALLLTQGRDTADDPAARYVAFTECADLAAGAGDAATALAAIGELARSYRVDVLDLRRAALVKAGTIATAAGDCETVMRLALETADQAVAVDAFTIVPQLVNLAEASANKTRQLSVAASIQVRLADLRSLVAEFARVKTAQAKLTDTPDDPQAHLAVGRFYALHKGQWDRGLEHLAKGSDAELAALAKRELARPEDGLQQAALGDAWWDYADNATGITRATARAHAATWYRTAQQSIKGITLTRIQSRIDEGSPLVATPAAPRGAVALLGLVDAAKDAAQGQWTRGTEGLTCERSAYACLQIPYEPPEEYDLTVSFTRTEDDGSIALLLAAQKRAFGFVLDIKGEARFERVNGKVAQDNPTVVPVAVSNGRAYTLTVEVRTDRIRALLDGKLLCEHKTDLKDLSRYSAWKLGDNTLCGIGANGAKVTFHTIDMVEVKGKGKPTR